MLIDAYQKHDPQEVIGALIGALAFVQGVEQTIPICEQVDSSILDWTTFHKIVKTVEDPVNHMQIIEKNVVLNGKTITKDISKSLDAWRSNDYFTFGASFGNTLRDTCVAEDNLFIF